MLFTNKNIVYSYFHTLRYLKPKQLFYQVFYKFTTKIIPRKILKPQALTLRERPNVWVIPPVKPTSFFPPNTFFFLNQRHILTQKHDWNNPAWPKLWLYNLHYFDDLCSEQADEIRIIHGDLITRWIDENPPGKGCGWEPYTLSLRIVNWTKWYLKGNNFSTKLQESLALQVEWLYKNIEYHLLGNHIFANAKALIFGGTVFRGTEADAWLKKGLQILHEELHEQILPDGGHFEQSPLYHCIILEDMLDLINLIKTYGYTNSQSVLVEKLIESSKKMLLWLCAMSHPDGDISLFNDSAIGIASQPQELIAYSKRVGLHIDRDSIDATSVIHLVESGYVRVKKRTLYLIADIGTISANYIPGHSHADTFGFELSIGNKRIFVDSGTSCYDKSIKRLQQRSTALHNSVVIDKKNSSDVWGSFRVARRATITEKQVTVDNNSVIIKATHDGYAHTKDRIYHCRQWKISDDEIEIIDYISGKGTHSIDLYFHCAPGIVLDMTNQSAIRLIENEKNYYCTILIDQNVSFECIKTLYYPEFGKEFQNYTIKVSATNTLPLNLVTKIVTAKQ